MGTINFTESQNYELQYMRYLTDESFNIRSLIPEYSRRSLLLSKRCRIKNKQFNFTPEIVESFARLDSLFDQASKEAYKKAEEIEKYFISEMKSGKSHMYDYEIDFNVNYYARKKFMGFNEMLNIPIHTCDFAISYYKQVGRKDVEESKHWQFKENHNMFQHFKEHPLKHQFHTYLMHDLTEHSDLSFSDILSIDEVQVETELLINHNYKLRDKSKQSKID